MSALLDRLKQLWKRCKYSMKSSNSAADSYWIRWAVQAGFVLFSILLGLQFHAFIKSIDQTPLDIKTLRPAAVEGYLPISSLMSLIYFLKTGIANTVHPAGLVIFSLTLTLAMTMRRGFCSWVCPFGTASEWLYRTGTIIFGRNFRLPKTVDILLRSVKYFLFGFFFYHIIKMPTAALQQWIHGPYNRIADSKMFHFFFNISATAIIVFGVLGILSLLFKNFWCRYLCPYGALLGLFSILSPTAVHRNQSQCTGCQRCADACPNRIPVHRYRRISSPECTACFSCIESCKQQKTLSFGLFRSSLSFSILTYGLIILAAFLFTSQIAQTIGYWHSDTSPAMYHYLYNNSQSIAHPRISTEHGSADNLMEVNKKVP